MKKINEFIALISAWVIEVLAFVFLPLIVYLAVYFALGIKIAEIIKLPEWMFISIVISGDFVRAQLAVYQGYKGFNVKAIRAISMGILFIVTSSIFLVFSLIEQINNVFHLPEAFYVVQMILFLIVFYFYAIFSIYGRWQKGEGALQAYMLKDETEDIIKTPENIIYGSNNTNKTEDQSH